MWACTVQIHVVQGSTVLCHFIKSDLSIHRFWYLLGILEPISHEYHWGMIVYNIVLLITITLIH